MPRTTISDFSLALARVDELLEKYEPKHKGAWKDQSLLSHANHGRIHAQLAEKDMLEHSIEYLIAPNIVSVIEENLASSACRALMLLQRFLQLRAEREKLPRPL